MGNPFGKYKRQNPDLSGGPARLRHSGGLLLLKGRKRISNNECPKDSFGEKRNQIFHTDQFLNLSGHYRPERVKTSATILAQVFAYAYAWKTCTLFFYSNSKVLRPLQNTPFCHPE